VILHSIGTIAPGQDGAIWGGFLFRFHSRGNCTVYTLADVTTPYATFRLPEGLIPHSNAVVFGSEYAQPGDEFPLLYSNIYNNYSQADDRLEGVCLVYRLVRENTTFSATLAQRITVGFADKKGLWRSESQEDRRPYGNFVIDRENGKYYAFTMMDQASSTRVFAFDLPRLTDGERVVLQETHILDRFDVPYSHFIQGACFHDGCIYSVEGFKGGKGAENPPALRIIDTVTREQKACLYFETCGVDTEPELIDVYDGTIYFSDAPGRLYRLEL